MMLARPARLTTVAAFLMAVLFGLFTSPLYAADREKLSKFLEVTGFDVALESIKLSADLAPQMLGINAKDFGTQWQQIVEDVFETEVMLNMGLDILEKTLSDEALDQASDFYASELGQRLVVAENDSHMQDENSAKDESGEQILNGLRGIGSARVQILARLNEAVSTDNNSVKAVQEVQIRVLMAAAAAGVVELQMDEPDLREAMRQSESILAAAMKENALETAAYTYQAFSDDELTAYAEALEQPKMQEVYSLLNAVQYEILANRLEEATRRLAGVQPAQEL